MNQEASRKLSPALRRLLAEPVQAPTQRLSLMVTTQGALEPAQRERLAGIGCRIRTVAGDVVSADLPAGALPELAALQFVRYVDLSRVLRLEREDGPSET